MISVLTRLSIVFVLVSVACSGPPQGSPRSPSPDAGDGGTPSPAATTRFERIACSLPPSQLLRVARGYHPERSGEIQMLTESQYYYGNFSHSGPWPYLQRVPMFLYGPGHVPAAGRVTRPVTSADIAPTFARHLDYDFDAPDGTAMEEAIEPDADPPRLIFTVVWDGAGRNVLAEHGGAWPTLKGLIPEGVWYEQATVGSSPSVTPAVHTTIGTGAFPATHGVMDLRYRQGDGLIGARGQGPSTVLVPALGDVYDMDRGNDPKVGLIGSTGVLGMIGGGSRLDGADADVAVTHQKDEWGLEPAHVDAYELPPYAVDVAAVSEDAVRELDLQDGVLDGRWLGDEIPDDLSEVPVFTESQTRLIEAVIRREGFGADDVPDLLFVNYKQIDKVGHRWSMESPQMEAVTEGLDDALEELVDILDRQVGEGEWMLALTSDHGATPPGPYSIRISELEADLQERFDLDDDQNPAILSARITQIWVDEQELAEHGHTLEQVANYILRYTKGKNADDPGSMSADEQSDRLYDVAFPGRVLEGLSCLEDG